MTHPPSPDPLDFDWRYDNTTAQTLASLLWDSPKIVAIGAPTVARLLEATGVDVTLVEPSQPLKPLYIFRGLDPDRMREFREETMRVRVKEKLTE
jgi:hypothetical protein